MSWQARLLTPALRWIEKPQLARASDPVRLRRTFAGKARLLFHAPKGTRMSEGVVADVPVLRVDGPWAQPGREILYFHGGGYVFGSPRTHAALAAQLGRRAGASVTLARYPLAPEHPFPAALTAARAVYDGLRAEHPGLMIGGDSAGGGLTFSLLGTLLADGAPLPTGAFGFSPLSDLTFTAGSLTTNARSEAVLPVSRVAEMVEMVLAGADPRNPQISPRFADFTGAPPVWLTVDETEILYDDGIALRDQVKAGGADVTLDVTRGLPHIWPIFHNVLPEARYTLDALAGWLTPLWEATGES